MISARIVLILLAMTVINTFVSEVTVDAVIKSICDPYGCDRECHENGKYFGHCVQNTCKCI
uniref:AKTx n=1 Tax=Centruroides hentzi TaxID=88313 RepID=A0A2I9LNP0_9SCOR